MCWEGNVFFYRNIALNPKRHNTKHHSRTNTNINWNRPHGVSWNLDQHSWNVSNPSFWALPSCSGRLSPAFGRLSPSTEKKKSLDFSNWQGNYLPRCLETEPQIFVVPQWLPTTFYTNSFLTIQENGWLLLEWTFRLQDSGKVRLTTTKCSL